MGVPLSMVACMKDLGRQITKSVTSQSAREDPVSAFSVADYVIAIAGALRAVGDY